MDERFHRRQDRFGGASSDSGSCGGGSSNGGSC